ncbi:MAG: hypothetical protein R2854_00600 [Caldilineaceae bacterium]
MTDREELRWGLDPARADTDNDGILDREELQPHGGWLLPYAPDKETRVWSNPLDPDVDNDGLSDLFERTQSTCPTCTPWADPANPAVFSPNVWNASPIALYVDDDSIDGYMAPAATVVYTTTTANNLSGGQLLNGTLAVDAPLYLQRDQRPGGRACEQRCVRIAGLHAPSRHDQPSTAAVIASKIELTDFAGVIWSWDPTQSQSVNGTANVHELVTVTPANWEQATLMVTREIAANGVQSIHAYLANTRGDLNVSRLLFTAPAGMTLTSPSVACFEDDRPVWWRGAA